LLQDGDRDKLDSKTKKCTFIGYGSDEMCYRLWDNETRKVVRSKNVIFNETELYKDKNNKSPEIQKECVEFEGIEKKKEASVEIPEFGDDSTDSGSSGDDSSNDYVEEEEETTPQNPESPVTPQLQPRRSSRLIRPPNRYSPSVNYILLTENGEPQCYFEAMGLKDSLPWELAMKEEMKSLEKNKTWHLTKLPTGKKALQNKWVFRVKDEHDGTKRYKARLVVKGFQQKEGIEFDGIFSPVVKMTTIRLVLSIVAAEGLHLEQLDVKTAFLHGDLEEDIYMTQPEGFHVKSKGN